MAVKTRADLIEEIAQRYGHFLRGTATSASTSTILDTANLYQPDDYWVGHYAYILTDADGEGAAPEGEERPVTDYDQATATLTVAPVFSAAVAADDTFELLPFQRAVAVMALNAAVREAADTWPVVIVDITTVTIATDDYDYTLPTDVVRLLSVLMRDDATNAWVEVPASLWRQTGTPGAQELTLQALAGMEAGDLVRLEYLARVDEMATDAATLGVGEPVEAGLVQFLIAYALYWLHEQAASANPAGGGFRAHLTLERYHLEEAERLRKGATSYRPRGTARTPRWARSRG